MLSATCRFPAGFIAHIVQTAKDPRPCCASRKCGSSAESSLCAESSLHHAFVPEPTSSVTRGNARVLPGHGEPLPTHREFVQGHLMRAIVGTAPNFSDCRLP